MTDLLSSHQTRQLRPRAILLDFYGTIVEEDDAVIGQICAQITAASPLAITSTQVGSY